MKQTISPITSQIDRLTALGRPRIAFGLAEAAPDLLANLKQSQNYVDIVLVGPPTIAAVKDLELITDTQPETKIAQLLVGGDVAGIVRGTLDDFKTREAYQQLTGEQPFLEMGIFEDPLGRQFGLGPISNPQGWTKEERLAIAERFGAWFADFDIAPNIAIFAAERHDTYPRKKHLREGVVGTLNKTYEEAEWLVSELQQQGYRAKNWSIDLNPAIEAGANILIPVNGMVGNQIFRIILVCGGKNIAAPEFGFSRPYEETSRTETDFTNHIKFLVARINQQKGTS